MSRRQAQKGAARSGAGPRSRGGFSTKIHLKTDFGGFKPIAFHLTGGEASDSRNFETLLDIGPGYQSARRAR